MAGVPAEHRTTPEHRRDLAEQRRTLYPRDQQIRPWSGTYPCSPCGGNGQRHGAARPQADTFGVTQQSDRDNAGPLRQHAQDLSICLSPRFACHRPFPRSETGIGGRSGNTHQAPVGGYRRRYRGSGAG